MSAQVLARSQDNLINYPDSDGQPMADNTVQFRWISTLVGELQDLFSDDPNVFVAGDLLWYPVEGNNKLRRAPDAMVVFGRPKGDRGSYKQWEEQGIAPQCVFEILSPANTSFEMEEKLTFYNRYGVEEYYLYDPDRLILKGWLRSRRLLQPIPIMTGWVSPRLGIRFELSEDDLVIYHPDGRPFVSHVAQAQRARLAEQQATVQTQRAKLAEQQATVQTQRAKIAEQRATVAEQQLQTEVIARLAAEAEIARLKALLASSN